MAEGKWIPDLTAATSLEKAARETFQRRLEALEQALTPALDALNPDPEPVHQLRVGARRTTVALDLFAGCLPPRVYRRARRALRDLRRSAGEARDWDVFLLTLKSKAIRKGGVSFLVGYAHGQRNAAQAALVQAAHDFSVDLAHHAEQVLGNLAAPRAHSASAKLASLARATLTQVLDELHGVLEPTPERLEELHQVRIIGKRLRYSMELFAGCFRAAFRDDLYPRIEEMQEILGALNDSRVATDNLCLVRARLKATDPPRWRQTRPEIDNWLRYHQRQLRRQTRLFHGWLEQWRLSGADEEFRALIQLPPED